MSDKKQTAVEWLIQMYFSQNKVLYGDEIIVAKEMEKQQIIEAHLDGQSLVSCKDEYAEQYYKETFNK